jgi:hypothetical protein
MLDIKKVWVVLEAINPLRLSPNVVLTCQLPFIDDLNGQFSGNPKASLLAPNILLSRKVNIIKLS